jgi:AcrR family transcriptional regulator
MTDPAAVDTGPVTYSLREAKKQRMRQDMVDSALRHFIEGGYEETSLEDICSSLLVSPRTLQRYFGGKEQLALDWQYTALDRFRAALAGRDRAQRVAEWWREYVLSIVALVERTELSRAQHRLVLSVPILHTRRLAIIQEYEDLLTAALAEEAGSDAGVDVRARLSAVVLLGASEAAFHRWVHDDDGPSYEELSAEALDVALGEFLPRPS